MPVPVPESTTADDECLAQISARTWSELRCALARATGSEPDDALLPAPVDTDPMTRDLELLRAAYALQPPRAGAVRRRRAL